MNVNKLTLTEVSQLLECSERTVQRYVESDKLPAHGAAKGRYWIWAEVREWDLKRVASKVSARCGKAAGSEGSDAPSAKDREMLARAEMRELELAEKRRQTISVQDFEKALVDVIVPTRLNLLAIASRVRGKIGNEAAAIVDEEIKQSLRLLAAGGVDVTA